MKKKTFLIVLIVLVLVLAGLAGVGFYLFRSTDTFISGNTDTETQLSQKDIDSVVRGVGEHIRLPSNENPVIAAIVDVNKLIETQPFYQGAENGDFLLIYPQAAKAIIYSQKRDIIVNVGPIIVDENAAAEVTGGGE